VNVNESKPLIYDCRIRRGRKKTSSLTIFINLDIICSLLNILKVLVPFLPPSGPNVISYGLFDAIYRTQFSPELKLQIAG
jgi:hypothetical protein